MFFDVFDVLHGTVSQNSIIFVYSTTSSNVDQFCNDSLTVVTNKHLHTNVELNLPHHHKTWLRRLWLRAVSFYRASAH